MLLLPRGQLALRRPLVQSPPIATQLLRDHRNWPPRRLQRFERVEEVLVGLSELSADLGLDRQAPRGQQLPFTRDGRTDRPFKGRCRVAFIGGTEIAQNVPILRISW